MNSLNLNLSLLLIVGASGLAGCATIGQRSPEVTTTPLRTDNAEVPTEEAIGSVSQSGTTITLIATPACRAVERTTVLKTVRIDHENRSAAYDWVAGVGGAGLVGLGVGTLIDARNVAPTSDSGQTYNPVGQQGATGLGIMSIVGGGLLAGIAIVDVVRANKVDVSAEKLVDPDRILQPKVACTGKVLPNAPVAGEVRSTFVQLGTLDESGKAVIDLDQFLGAETIARGETMGVRVLGSKIGTASLKPLFELREERAWKRLEVSACKEPTSPQSCQPIRDYLLPYGDGPHGDEGRAILAEAQPKLDRLADDEAWKGMKDSVEACASRKVDTPLDVDALCVKVRRFVNDHPKSAHVPEAEAALKKAEARRTAMVADAERKQRAQAAAAQQQAAADNARRIDACKKGCIPQCKALSDFVPCVQRCEARCQ